MLNSNSIKAEVRKQFPNVEIIEVVKHKWGLFFVKVKKENPRSTKFGMISGETDFEVSENGIVLEKKIDWV